MLGWGRIGGVVVATGGDGYREDGGDGRKSHTASWGRGGGGVGERGVGQKCRGGIGEGGGKR